MARMSQVCQTFMYTMYYCKAEQGKELMTAVNTTFTEQSFSSQPLCWWFLLFLCVFRCGRSARGEPRGSLQRHHPPRGVPWLRPAPAWPRVSLLSVCVCVCPIPEQSVVVLVTLVHMLYEVDAVVFQWHRRGPAVYPEPEQSWGDYDEGRCRQPQPYAGQWLW